MYSTRSSLPFGIKPVGLGVAFVVNGALLTALYLFIAPVINPIPKDPPLIGEMIEEPPPPPPVDQPKPTKEQVVESVIYTPKVEVPVIVDNPVIKTTNEQPKYVPQTPDPGTSAGTSETKPADPPPLPPLIVAQIDSRYADAFQPQYPASEIRLERDGKVAVRVLIGTDGRVKAVEQVSATSPAFFEATKRQAMSKWRFKPASRGGTPQESWKVMNVRFEMKSVQ